MKAIPVILAIAASACTFSAMSSAQDFDHQGRDHGWDRTAQVEHQQGRDAGWRDYGYRGRHWDRAIVERRFERVPLYRDDGRVARWRHEPRERFYVERSDAPPVIVGQVWERPMSYARTQVIEVPTYSTVVTASAPAPVAVAAPVTVVTRSTIVAVKKHRAPPVHHVAVAKAHAPACAAPAAHVAGKSKAQRIG